MALRVAFILSALFLAAAAAAAGCGDDISDAPVPDGEDDGTGANDDGADDDGAGEPGDDGESDEPGNDEPGDDNEPDDDVDLEMQAEDFGCILDGTKVRKFFVWNPLGKLEETLAVANSADGGTYPVGSVLQLVPFEAMVKRRAGFSPETNDWEFFFLSTRGGTTAIEARGGAEVTNQFGGSCFDCHAKAEAQWDLVCETGHGCDPLPIGDEIIENLQNNDSRCN